MVVIPTLQQISQQHTSVYENYFRQVNPSGTGTIGAIDAAKFLKKSGLPEGILHKVWELADQGEKGYLDKEGFYIALKLISLAQNGRDVNLHSLTLPSIAPTMGDTTPESPVVPPSVSLSDASWAVKAKDKLRYDGMFDSSNPVGGLLSGEKAKPILLNSKLPVDILGKIWELSDIDKDGSLDRDEFAVAMHLVYQCMNSEKNLPTALPQELVPPSKRSTIAPMASLPSISLSSNGTLASTDNSFGTSFVREENVTSSNWVVTSAEQAQYEKMFRKVDTDQNGLVSGLEIKDILMASGLSQNVLAHIWNLCDIKNSGTLNLEQFSLAMYLIKYSKSGKDPPQQLSPEMVPPSMRNNNDLSSLKLESTSNDFSAIKELDQISTDIETLGREKSSLQKEITETEEAIRRRKAEIEDLHGELDKANRGLDALTKQKQEAQIQLDNLNQEHKNYEIELREIEAKRDDKNKMINQLKKKLSSQTSSIKEQENELQKRRKELDSLRTEENNLEQQVEENKKELENLKTKIALTKKENQTVQNKIEKLSDENVSIKEEITQLTNTINPPQLATTSAASNGSASLNEMNDTFEARFKLQDDQTSARATAGSSPVSSISGFSVGSGRVDEENDDFKDTDPFKNKADPFGGNEAEIADPFSSDDPFKSDPFKSVSFADDPFSGDPFQQEDPFKPISASTGMNSRNTDSETAVATRNDPFSSLDPFGSGAFVTSSNQGNKFQPSKPKSVDSSASDPFSTNSLFTPAASSTAADETECAKKPTSSPDDPFSNDPFSNKDPFAASVLTDSFNGASATASSDPFAANTKTKSDTNLFLANKVDNSDPFSTAGKADPFSSSSSINKDDLFSSASDPFAATVTSSDKTDPFSASSESDPFSSTTTTTEKEGGENPWFAFSESSKSEKHENSFSSTQVASSEDQQLAWAKRESEREEEARKKRLEELKQQEEMEIALALKQSVESSSDA